MAEKRISAAVIARLPRYYRYLGELKEEGIERISSKDLSRRMHVTASQIRQDLNNFGEFALYYFKVMDKDGHVKVDMVPCRETKDGGVAGLYDLQRNEFYPSESSTPFDYTIAEPPATPDAPQAPRVAMTPRGCSRWMIFITSSVVSGSK